MSDEWASMKEVVQELSGLFRDSVDSASIRDVKAIMAEINAVLGSRERSMQESIKCACALYRPRRQRCASTHAWLSHWCGAQR